jgi:hypothetical protein
LNVIVVELPAAPDHVAKTLRATGAEIVASYLPMMLKARPTLHVQRQAAKFTADQVVLRGIRGQISIGG